MRFRHARERLREPDAELARELRRLSVITVLLFLCGALLLFLLHALSSSAPHPLSLFLGDVVLVTPLLFRFLTAAAVTVLVALLCLRIYVHAAIRRNSR